MLFPHHVEFLIQFDIYDQQKCFQKLSHEAKAINGDLFYRPQLMQQCGSPFEISNKCTQCTYVSERLQSMFI